jgi:hypothetical protein
MNRINFLRINQPSLKIGFVVMNCKKSKKSPQKINTFLGVYEAKVAI